MTPAAPAASGNPAPIVQMEVDGAITHATAEFLQEGFSHARSRDAQLVVIELDTPGGLLDATRAIVRIILDAPMPVVVYVSPAGARAGSAGVFITLAAHVAAMVPTSRIGAAHPVSAFGGDVEGDMGDKVTNDAAAWARSLAETRGRNAEWASNAVTKSESITAGEALDRNVVDVIAKDLTALLVQLDGRAVDVHGAQRRLHTRDAPIEVHERSGKQRLHEWLADPSLIYLLLLLGLLGLFVEFQNPGLIVPGALGVICLGLVFGVQALPINGLGVALILASVVLLVLEVYVTSFGMLTVAGIACLIAGSYMLFDVPESTLRLNEALIWTVALVFTLLVVSIGVLLARAKLQGPTSGLNAPSGRLGVVQQAIAPGIDGKVFFDGTYWNARSNREIPAGAQVRVDKIEGLLAHVRPASDESGSLDR